MATSEVTRFSFPCITIHKNISFVTLEGDTILKTQKWSGAILSALFQYFSTNKSWPPYKSLRS